MAARQTAGKPDFSENICNNNALRRATRNLSLLFDDVIAPSGLRAGQFSILVHADTMSSPTMKALATELVMDLSALGHTLKPLIRDGLLTLQPDAKDRRSKHVALTPAGFAKLEETTALWREAQARVEAILGEDRARQIRVDMSELATEDFSSAFRAGTPAAARASGE